MVADNLGQAPRPYGLILMRKQMAECNDVLPWLVDACTDVWIHVIGGFANEEQRAFDGKPARGILELGVFRNDLLGDIGVFQDVLDAGVTRQAPHRPA